MNTSANAITVQKRSHRFRLFQAISHYRGSALSAAVVALAALNGCRDSVTTAPQRPAIALVTVAFGELGDQRFYTTDTTAAPVPPTA